MQNPYVADHRDSDARRARSGARFVAWAVGGDGVLAELSDFAPDELADISNGLSLVNLNVVLAQARTGQRRVDAGRFRKLKKEMIERQCQGLVEFIEPAHTLDMVVGHEAAKERLPEDAELDRRGQLDAAPMGYLICGPVGTGKTFLAECYAGSIGIPCVKLLNFRSKYVGETEGNLEQVLTVLRSLGPVVVIIDEADAALGHARGRRRLGHLGPRLLDDRQPDGRHPLPRPDRLDAADQPARPAADRPQAPGPGRGAHPAVLSRRRRRVPRDVPGDGPQEQGRARRTRPSPTWIPASAG